MKKRGKQIKWRNKKWGKKRSTENRESERENGLLKRKGKKGIEDGGRERQGREGGEFNGNIII